MHTSLRSILTLLTLATACGDGSDITTWEGTCALDRFSRPLELGILAEQLSGSQFYAGDVWIGVDDLRAPGSFNGSGGDWRLVGGEVELRLTLDSRQLEGDRVTGRCRYEEVIYKEPVIVESGAEPDPVCIVTSFLQLRWTCNDGNTAYVDSIERVDTYEGPLTLWPAPFEPATPPSE